MHLFRTVEKIKYHLVQQRKQGLSIGFVPTMGALHQGHLSLVKASLERNDLTVSSIFVNPTQFNEQKDLEKYPRTTSKDIDKLLRVGCHVIFFPEVEEIYPPGTTIKLPFTFENSSLTKVMEGRFRPGHFDGVAQVVYRLLDIVEPHRLYMGQKDYQQVQVVQSMIDQAGLTIDLEVCPIIREKDGLAMSSRNRRLDETLRPKAGIIHQTLNWTKETIQSYSLVELKARALKMLTIDGFNPEYLEIVDSNTLQPITDYSAHNEIVVCTAVWVGQVRLIDNLVIKF